MPADNSAAYIALDGDGAADRIFAGARRRTRQPGSRDRRVIWLLGKTRQQVGLAVGRFRPGDTSARSGLQSPDFAAPGTLGLAFKVPKRIRIEKILCLTTGACEQHGYLLVVPLDTLLLFKPAQLFRTQPSQFAQDVLVIRAHRFQRPLETRRSSGHFVGWALVHQVAVGRVIQPLDGTALLPVRLVGNFFGVPDRLVVDVGLVQQCGNLLLGLIGHPLFQPGIDFNLALGLYARVMLSILLRRRAISNDLTQLGEVLVFVSADQDVALLLLLGVLRLWIGGFATLDDPVDAQLGIPVAPALADNAVPAVQRQRILDLARDPVHLRVFGERSLTRDFVAPVQRGQNLYRTHHAAPVIGQPDGVLGRSSAHEFWLAGHAEVTALSLAKDVIGGAHAPWPPAAEAAQPAIHQPGVDLAQLSVADPPALESAGAIVLHHHIRFGGQFLYDRLTLGAVEVT